MNRVFICGYYNFPRGGAASNYVQYLSKVFIGMGKEVIAITNRNAEVELENNRYLDINVEDIKLRKDKIGHYLDFNFRMGTYIEQILQRYDLDKNDIVIAYSRDTSTLQSVLSMGKKTGAKTGVCVVEWFEMSDYPKGIRDILFWNSQNAFYNSNPRFDFILPISTYIERYYKEKNCNTFCIPCLADTNEFPYTEKTLGGKRVIVYPGNGKMKDELTEMMLAISQLTPSEMGTVEFHVCGVSREAHRLVNELSLRNYLGQAIIIHEWMTYEELVLLYKKAHFLLLARKITRMTKANFPSKIPETLTYGIIPICSKVGDYTQYYLQDGETAIIMDDCDAKTVCANVKRAIELPDDEIKRMSADCRKLAQERFDFRNWIDSLAQFLEKDRVER